MRSAAQRVQAPTLLSFRIAVQGKASHAGFHPEQGIHAICVAASAARRLQNGWLDENTTRNIGTIHGGTQTNIVPERCVFTGEIRSFDHEQAMRTWEETKRVFEEEARSLGADVEAEHTVHILRLQDTGAASGCAAVSARLLPNTAYPAICAARWAAATTIRCLSTA